MTAPSEFDRAPSVDPRRKPLGEDAAAPEIDPEMAAILAAEAPLGDVQAMPVAEARAAVRARHLALNPPPLAGVAVSDGWIDGPAGPMRARRLTPAAAAPGAIVYFHGGGWTFCDVETHTRTMAGLAAASGREVVGVDYRLAPEAPFPAAFDDAVAACRAVAAERAGPFAVAGDSAGANLALAAAQALAQDREAAPAAALLFYGCYAAAAEDAARPRLGDGRFGLTAARMDWFWRNYLGAAEGDPRAEPALGPAAGLAPSLIVSAGLDPLRAESFDLAERLRAAGSATRHLHYHGVVHGFLQYSRDLAQARAALEAAGAWVAMQLAGAERA